MWQGSLHFADKPPEQRPHRPAHLSMFGQTPGCSHSGSMGAAREAHGQCSCSSFRRDSWDRRSTPLGRPVAEGLPSAAPG